MKKSPDCDVKEKLRLAFHQCHDKMYMLTTSNTLLEQLGDNK